MINLETQLRECIKKRNIQVDVSVRDYDQNAIRVLIGYRRTDFRLDLFVKWDELYYEKYPISVAAKDIVTKIICSWNEALFKETL
jgi:hypothetical protein